MKDVIDLYAHHGRPVCTSCAAGWDHRMPLAKVKEEMDGFYLLYLCPHCGDTIGEWVSLGEMLYHCKMGEGMI